MESIKQVTAAIFREAFGGLSAGADGTWFVQAGQAIFETLDDLDAVEASRAVAPGINTIAAHAIHTAYYIELGISALNGVEIPGDWPGSWKVQTVTDDEWSAVKATLHERVTKFLATAGAVPDEFTEMIQGDLVANVAHAAYHLGAIRQLYLTVKAERRAS